MGSHRVRYQGPPSFAVKAATLLADTEGIELSSAGTPEPSPEVPGEASLTLTLRGTLPDLRAAVRRLGAQLPPDARVTILDEGLADGPA